MLLTQIAWYLLLEIEKKKKESINISIINLIEEGL